MTDFHSHVLPGIDDGSDSVSTSLQMMDMWREQGVGCVCATPHFYAEHVTPERFLERRARAFQALTDAGGNDARHPRLRLGAEVRFFNGISITEELPALCLERTRLLLLEMPFSPWTERMLGEVGDICRRGIVPVAAHAERYFGFNSRKTIRRFFDMDILIQCNAEFFLSHRTARKALALLKEGRIHFLGSDAHDISSRTPNLRAAWDVIGEKLGQQAIRRLNSMEEMLDFGRDVRP